MATYRRAPQDIAEVEYIVELIDADIKTNLLTWAQAVDNRKIHDRISTQKKWHEIRDSLKGTEEGKAGEIEPAPSTRTSPAPAGAFDGAPEKEVPSNKSKRGEKEVPSNKSKRGEKEVPSNKSKRGGDAKLKDATE